MDVRPVDNPATPLDYAPAPPRHRVVSRRTLNIAVLATVLLLAGWLVWSLREPMNAFLVQRAALASAPTPGTVVYLDTAPGDWRRVPETALRNPSLGALAVVPPPLSRQHAIATVFLGRMTTPGGIARVVVVEVERGTELTHGNLFLQVSAVAFKPATPFRRPSAFVRETDRSDYRWMNGVTETARVTAATPDPTDPSHLWFTYSVGGQTVTYDLWLRDPRAPGGDVQILIQPRPPVPPDGPLTREKPWRF